MTDGYARYHGPLLQLARAARDDGAWKAKLREILASFDVEVAPLPVPCRRRLAEALAVQLEHDMLRFADPVKAAVLALAIKHFDADAS